MNKDITKSIKEMTEEEMIFVLNYIILDKNDSGENLIDEKETFLSNIMEDMDKHKLESETKKYNMYGINTLILDYVAQVTNKKIYLINYLTKSEITFNKIEVGKADIISYPNGYLKWDI